MSAPHRMVVKLFFSQETRLPASAFVPVFHRWIQREAVEDLLIDVHNYAHIHRGTGILLVGHEGDYAIDFGGGRSGILYRLKRDAQPTPGESLAVAIRRVAAAAQLLQGERSLAGLRVRTDELEILVVDRLAFPNTRETFDAVKEELSTVVRRAFSDEAATLVRIDNDAREPLALRAAIPSAPSLDVVGRLDDVGSPAGIA